jgi:hypothetical protein
MAVTCKWFGSAIPKAFNKEIDAGSDAIYIMLTTVDYAVDQDTHDYQNDVTNEVVGAGYDAGGKLLANVNVTFDAASNEVRFLADDAVWAASTITARKAVIYDATPGAAASNPLIIYIDFGADVASTADNFTVDFDGGIVAKLTLG